MAKRLQEAMAELRRELEAVPNVEEISEAKAHRTKKPYIDILFRVTGDDTDANIQRMQHTRGIVSAIAERYGLEEDVDYFVRVASQSFPCTR